MGRGMEGRVAWGRGSVGGVWRQRLGESHGSLPISLPRQQANRVIVITSPPRRLPPARGIGVTRAEAPPLLPELLVTSTGLFITWAPRA